MFTMSRTGWLLVLLAVTLVAPAGAQQTERERRSSYGAFRLPPPEPEQPEPPALGPNEPTYFLVGRAGDTTARLQFSFQYRFLDEQSDFVRKVPWMGGLHLAYTQTSLWNLSQDSKPFLDTSYRPSLFWQHNERSEGWAPDFLRVGYEHESNGQSIDRSRSIDTLFLHPGWQFQLIDRPLLVAPKLYVYLEKDENPDISDHRGNVDWLIRYGRDDSWMVSTLLRAGYDGHGSAQLDISYPLRRPIFARTGGFLYVQLFQGYGESLLDYDEETNGRVRVGLAIVR